MGAQYEDLWRSLPGLTRCLRCPIFAEEARYSEGAPEDVQRMLGTLVANCELTATVLGPTYDTPERHFCGITWQTTPTLPTQGEE